MRIVWRFAITSCKSFASGSPLWLTPRRPCRRRSRPPPPLAAGSAATVHACWVPIVRQLTSPVAALSTDVICCDDAAAEGKCARGFCGAA